MDFLRRCVTQLDNARGMKKCTGADIYFYKNGSDVQSYSGDKMSLSLGLVPRLKCYGFDFFWGVFFVHFVFFVYHADGDEYLMLFQSLFLLLVLLLLQFCLMVIFLQVRMVKSVISCFTLVVCLLCFVFVLTFLVAALLIVLNLSHISCPTFLLSSHKAVYSCFLRFVSPDTPEVVLSLI